MRIIFSKHALLKMRERRIPESKVIAVIKKPTSQQAGYVLRMELFGRFGKRHLKVIILNTPQSIIVVTTHWVEKIR